jgi:hypothetical protein
MACRIKRSQVVHLSCLPCIHEQWFSFDLIHENPKGWYPVNKVANSANHHHQSISQGTVHSYTMWCPYWNVGVLCHADDTSAIMFSEKHSLRGLAVHFARRHHKCQLSDIVESCTHQWQNTIPCHRFKEKLIRKILSTVPVDCHKLINASFCTAGSITRKQFPDIRILSHKITYFQSTNFLYFYFLDGDKVLEENQALTY